MNKKAAATQRGSLLFFIAQLKAPWRPARRGKNAEAFLNLQCAEYNK